MLNFFRKLRRKEMNTGRYLKYALGEIILVVIGILIALSINNWSEGLKKLKREDLTISILIDEIETNLETLKKDLVANNQILDSLNLYLQEGLQKQSEYEKAQFVSYVLNYSWGKLEYPTLDQELGPNRLIRNRAELNTSFKALDAAHTNVDFKLDYLNELFNTQTVPYLLESGAGTGLINTMFQYNERVSKLSNLYGSESLNNILSIQQLFLFSYNGGIQNLINQSESTLEVLKGL